MRCQNDCFVFMRVCSCTKSTTPTFNGGKAEKIVSGPLIFFWSKSLRFKTLYGTIRFLTIVPFAISAHRFR